MNLPFETVFDRISTALTVGDISTPMRVVTPDIPLEAAWELLFGNPDYEPMPNFDDWFMLVADDNKTHGYICQDGEYMFAPLSGTAGDYAEVISLEMIIPKTLPIADLIPLLENQSYFFVMTKNRVTDVVTFQHLNKRHVSLLIYALMSRFELGITAIMRANFQFYCGHIPAGALTTAQRLLEAEKDRRFSRSSLVDYLSFSAKMNAFVRADSQLFTRLLANTEISPTQFQKQIIEVRNVVAHSRAIQSVLSTPEQLASFFRDLKGIALSSLLR